MPQTELLTGMADVFAYCVEHDRGLAPNPFFGVCSLAVCKPAFRKAARRGDYVVGTSSYDKRKGGVGGRVIYVMQVTEKIGFDDYWRDPRFQRKRAKMGGSRLQRCGDNIYHRDLATGDWIQEDSLHRHADGRISLADRDTDTGHTDRVLLSDRFTYWGDRAPMLPPHLAMFGRFGVRSRRHFEAPNIAAFIAWATPLIGQGRIGLPIDWRQ